MVTRDEESCHGKMMGHERRGEGVRVLQEDKGVQGMAYLFTLHAYLSSDNPKALIRRFCGR